MKIPLHYKREGHLTQQEAFDKVALWHEMIRRNPNGFRQPIGTKSKRIKPRQGRGIKKNEGGCFQYLAGLMLTAKHGEANATP